MRCYLQKYYENLLDSARNTGLISELFGFSALVGSKYGSEDNRLMIVGRSVDGWRKSFYVSNESNSDIINEKIYYIPESDRHCEMSWLKRSRSTFVSTKGKCGYNYKKSSFFSSSRDVLYKLSNDRISDWYSHIVWSNVYKLSPLRGNPNDKLRGVQIDTCSKILNAEIDYFKPTHILFITGGWGRKIIQSLSFSQIPTDNVFTKPWKSHVRFVGKVNDSKVVIAERPEAKSRRKWVADVYDSFQSID